MNDVNSFNSLFNNITEIITKSNDKNNKSKKKYKKIKMLTTVLKSLDTFVIIATTSGSFTLSLAGIGSTAIPKSTATVCGLSLVNKVRYEKLFKSIIISKNNIQKIHEQ